MLHNKIMKNIIYLLFSCYLFVSAVKAQSIHSWDGAWTGQYTIISRDGQKTFYTMFINFEHNEILLKDDKNSVINVNVNSPLSYNSSDLSLVQKFVIKLPGETECAGKMRYKFDGNNLLKAFGEFIPEQRNCLKATVTLNRNVGNMWLKALNPLSGNPVNLDATEIDDFHQGGAIIRKGENFAIIDKAGKLFIPWGKYKFHRKGGYEIDKDKCGFRNGISVVRDPVTEKYGFINTTGKLIVPCTLFDATPCEADGFAWGKEVKENGEEVFYFINSDGKKFEIKRGLIQSFLAKNESIYCVQNGESYEFYHKTGRLLLKTKRRIKGPYSDGLIKVDTTFELAGNKTGFIDISNRLVIPYRKETIGNFHCGLALVIPHTIDDFKYGFLNKKNELQIKLKYNDEIKEINQPTDFNPFKTYDKSEGCISWLRINNKLASLKDDGELTIDPLSEEAKEFNLENAKFLLYGNLDNDQVYLPFESDISFFEPWEFTTGGVGGGVKYITARKKTVRGVVGQATYNGNVTIQPVFNKLSFQDAYSELTKATFYDEASNTNIEGYINKHGIFVMIKSPK